MTGRSSEPKPREGTKTGCDPVAKGPGDVSSVRTKSPCARNLRMSARGGDLHGVAGVAKPNPLEGIGLTIKTRRCPPKRSTLPGRSPARADRSASTPFNPLRSVRNGCPPVGCGGRRALNRCCSGRCPHRLVARCRQRSIDRPRMSRRATHRTCVRGSGSPRSDFDGSSSSSISHGIGVFRRVVPGHAVPVGDTEWIRALSRETCGGFPDGHPFTDADVDRRADEAEAVFLDAHVLPAADRLLGRSPG